MTAPHWEIETVCPTDWAARLAQCGGGPFQSPVGLEVSGLSGGRWYGTYRGADVQGVAVGMWRRCRLSVRSRHVYLPSAPAFAAGAVPAEALAQLVEGFARDGAAEVVMDSFDQPASADTDPPPPRGALFQPERREYVVHLDASPDALVERWSTHHRRQLSGIEAGGWALRLLDGASAQTLLATVQRHAAARAASRGSGFDLPVASVAAVPFDAARPWGACVFSAWRDDTPLAAALIGWAGRRAYYLQGGAMPAGYSCNASLWLHWRTLTALAAAGFTVYSLGGAPASAVEPGAPAFGLHRFKVGFGSEVVSCRGLRWDLRPGHLRAHRAAAWGRIHLRDTRRTA
jgi:GNAT acetyltransferase-like protein